MGLIATLMGHAVMRFSPPPARGPVAPTRMTNLQAWQQHSHAQAPMLRTLPVIRRVQESRQMVSLWLEADGDTLAAVQPGQFFTLVTDIDGQEVRRAYSVSNLPVEDGALRLTAKKLPGGVMSGWLHGQLKAGDTLTIQGPSGHFVLPDTLPERLVMIAGGSGITPIRSLVAAALQRQPDLPITLWYACRNSAQAVFRGELEQLASEHPSLQVKLLLSQPPASWSGARGRMSQSWLQAQLPELNGASRAHVYLCGPEGLVDTVQQYLSTQGFPASQCHVELFRPAARAVQQHPTEPWPVQFSRSAKAVVAQPGQSLLDAGLAAGMNLPYSCQVGGCGHCRVRVSQGDTVSDTPNCLSDAEYQAGYRLACLTYPCSPVTVEA